MHFDGDNGPPRIDVIIPCFNQGEYLACAITSVLNQSTASVSVILVDDGSTDNTADVARQFSDEIDYIHQRRRGAAEARNAGLRQSHGDYVMFLDADDYLEDGALSAYADAIRARPEVDVFYGRWINVDRDRAKLADAGYVRLEDDAFHEILQGHCPAIHSAIFRRSVIVAAGAFDGRYQRQEDWDLWLRVAHFASRFAFVPDAVSVYRRYDHLSPSEARRSDRDALGVLGKVAGYHGACDRCGDLMPAIRSEWQASYYRSLKREIRQCLADGRYAAALTRLAASVGAHPFVVGRIARNIGAYFSGPPR